MMLHEVVAQSFLAQHRVVLVGASENPKSFGNAIYRELRAHGYEVVPVNPNSEIVEGDLCYPDLEPVAGFHRAHRTIRHLNGSIAKAS